MNDVSIPEAQRVIVREVEAWALQKNEYPALVTDDDYNKAGQDLKTVKAMAEQVEDARSAITGPLNKALKAANDFFRVPAQRLSTIENLIKNRIAQYTAARKAEAQKAQEKADREAEKTRARLIARAEKAEEQGNVAKASKLEMQAAHVVSPNVTLAPPVIPGLSQRPGWDFKITDETKVPREFLSLDLVKIRAHVRIHKGATKIEGVEVFEVSRVAVRGG